jgi:hypothetical protein
MTMHGTLAGGRWRELTLAEQLANVGSEVDRAIRAWEGQRLDRFNRALDRALELLDLTIGDERWRGHRRGELLRVREEFCGLFFGDAPSPDSARGLSAYFFRFGVLARRDGGNAGSAFPAPQPRHLGRHSADPEEASPG